jgi:hypothetical protein
MLHPQDIYHQAVKDERKVKKKILKSAWQVTSQQKAYTWEGMDQNVHNVVNAEGEKNPVNWELWTKQNYPLEMKERQRHSKKPPKTNQPNKKPPKAERLYPYQMCSMTNIKGNSSNWKKDVNEKKENTDIQLKAKSNCTRLKYSNSTSSLAWRLRKQLKIITTAGQWLTPVIPALWRLRKEDHEFKAILHYIVSLRSVQATEWNPVSKNK